MLLEFDRMEETIIPHFYGGEKETAARMFADERVRILCGRLAPGASIGTHPHDAGSEMVYILRGTGRAVYDGGEELLRPGVCHYCPKGHTHSLINDGDGDLEFFAVVPRQ